MGENLVEDPSEKAKMERDDKHDLTILSKPSAVSTFIASLAPNSFHRNF